jgi:hypothetical protein
VENGSLVRVTRGDRREKLTLDGDVDETVSEAAEPGLYPSFSQLSAHTRSAESNTYVQVEERPSHELPAALLARRGSDLLGGEPTNSDSLLLRAEKPGGLWGRRNDKERDDSDSGGDDACE